MIVEDSSTFWIGLDDTDEREHGCTTHDFNDLLNTLVNMGIKIEDPRLVRLWPFAPQRTRGNAALSARVKCDDFGQLESILQHWFQSKYDHVQQTDYDHSAQPTLLVTPNQLPESMYWETVRDHVQLQVRHNELSKFEHRLWHTKAGLMGLIGATAAIAWRGNEDWTWECTAWRLGKGPRDVPLHCVEEMASKFPGTFLNRDPNAKRSMIAPRTPCPVLYGIRGETKTDVVDAHHYLQSLPVEKSASYRAFRSNQATDDHLEYRHTSTVDEINIMKGGHVEILAEQKILSFSPGGSVNRLAQSLEKGDVIEWYGLPDSSGTFHLEKLKLVQGQRNHKRPKCKCGSRFKSKGENQPLKCPDCGLTTEKTWESHSIQSNWAEPPVSTRRHLSKPLSRIGKSEG